MYCAPYAQPHPPPASKGQVRSLLLLYGLWLCMTTRGDIAPMGGSTNLGSPTSAHHTPAQQRGQGPSTEFCTHASPACHSSHAWQPWPCPAEIRVPALNSGEHCRIGAAPEALAQRHQRLNFCDTIAPAPKMIFFVSFSKFPCQPPMVGFNWQVYQPRAAGDALPQDMAPSPAKLPTCGCHGSVHCPGSKVGLLAPACQPGAHLFPCTPLCCWDGNAAQAHVPHKPALSMAGA